MNTHMFHPLGIRLVISLQNEDWPNEHPGTHLGLISDCESRQCLSIFDFGMMFNAICF